MEDERIALDVDTPEDARRVMELGEGTKTKAFLSRTLVAGAVAPSPGLL